MQAASAAPRRGGCRGCRAAASNFTLAELGEERVGVSSLPERGRRPVAWVDDRVGREALEQGRIEDEERLPVAVRPVGTSHRAGEENISGEERAVGVEGEVAQEVARDYEGLERDAGEVELLVALQEDVRRVVARDSPPTRE